MLSYTKYYVRDNQFVDERNQCKVARKMSQNSQEE